jgi:hypothetical protein
MSQSVENINEMFNIIESKIKGGANDTEPYNTFRSTLNSIYDYFSVIFVNNKANNDKYQSSVNNLDKTCDCSKYKCKEEYTEENEDIEENTIIDTKENIEISHDINVLEKEGNNEGKSKLLLKSQKIL